MGEIVSKLTQEDLKDLFFYYPNDGIFVDKENGRIAGVLNSNGYFYITIEKIHYNRSKLAFLYMQGHWPENIIDHKNRDKSNDKWKNLRHVTEEQNQKNRSISKRNKSGISGLFLDKKTKMWIATIGDKGKQIYLGRFKEKIDAITMRKDAEKVYDYNF